MIAKNNLRLTFALSGGQKEHVWGTLGPHTKFLAANACIDKSAVQDPFFFVASIILVNHYPAGVFEAEREVNSVIRGLFWLQRLPYIEIVREKIERFRNVYAGILGKLLIDPLLHSAPI